MHKMKVDKMSVHISLALEAREMFLSLHIGFSLEVGNPGKNINFPLRDCLRTHEVFPKYQCFYFNYHKFSIKSYVVDVY